MEEVKEDDRDSAHDNKKAAITKASALSKSKLTKTKGVRFNE